MRILLFTASCLLYVSCLTKTDQRLEPGHYLISFADTATGECGYKDQNGRVVIPAGKYLACFTDTFRNYAIVLKNGKGFIGIDRNENLLYDVFAFDNAPDDASDGLFRIESNGKIGYADAVSGTVVTAPRFDCAYPFENGVAKVAESCHTQAEGEHSSWVSDSWFYINKSGIRIDP
jgi:hypothetical protein